MSMRTQGTELYFIDPADGEVVRVGCPTSIEGIDTTLEQIETTCLDDTTRTYEAGLATPGTATFAINTDTSDASHIRLHQLKIAGVTLKFAVGWSDGTGTPPTSEETPVDSDNFEFVLPTTRSWITFEGFINSYPFSFAQNSVVNSTIGIQVSGEPELVPATT